MGYLVAIGFVILLGILVFLPSKGIYNNYVSMGNGAIAPGGGFRNWLNNHPKSKEIYNLVEGGKFSREGTIDKTGKELIEKGAKLAILMNSSSGGDYFIITDEMVLAGSETKADLYTGSKRKQAKNYARLSHSVAGTVSTTTVKEKSVAKSAAVGGIIAGGAGAVVGAAIAADHNRNKAGQTVSHFTPTGGIKDDGVCYHFYSDKHTQFALEKQAYHSAYKVWAAQGIDIKGKRINTVIKGVLS
ncbi:MAG: hypothetical protein IJJ99_08500 [Oscillospiraceae bacterium]|nr:hypothetical protein [Oscillospiraceae bacterium]